MVTNNEVEEWSEIYVSENRVDSRLQPILNQVIGRWRDLNNDEERELSKSQIRKYCKQFSYLSMIHEFGNLELYRHYLFFEYLKKKFPPDGVEKIDVSDLVDLESLNLVTKGEINISLEDKNTVFDPKKSGSGKVKKEEEFDLLSEILNEINDLYGQLPNGTEEGSKKLIEEIVNDEVFKTVLLSKNTKTNKRVKLEQIYKEKNIKTLDISTKLFEIFDKKEMRERVINTLISKPEIIGKFEKNI